MSEVPRKVQLSVRAQLEKFREHPDPTPVEVPGGARGPQSLAELVADQVSRILSGRAALQPDSAMVEDLDDWPDESGDPLENLSVHQLAEMEHEVIAAERMTRQDPGTAPETGGEEPPGSAVQALVEPGAEGEH